MVLAPINTDAPIYHWPRATVGLILVNVAAFILTASGSLGAFEEVVAPRYGLIRGAGLRPWQWITSNFLHYDWLHLTGNMLFLWGLGLVVEGKIGWRRFLALYLGLGVAECAIEQVALGVIPGNSCGSSAIVFGLLAVALVWAPKNDLEVAFWAPVHGVGTFDVSIGAFALIVLAVQGLLAWWIGPAVLLHLIGGVLGFAAGTMMLRRGLVDCEGWDLYSVLRGRAGRPDASSMHLTVQERPPEQRPAPEPPRPRRKADPQRGAVLRKAKAINRVRTLLQRGRAQDAYEVLRRTQHILPEWQLPVRDHLQLADALQQSRRWNEAVALWEEYVERHPRDSDPIRILAAGVLLGHHQRPHAALRMIEPLAGARLHPRLEARRRRIEEQARRLIESGVIELDQSLGR